MHAERVRTVNRRIVAATVGIALTAAAGGYLVGRVTAPPSAALVAQVHEAQARALVAATTMQVAQRKAHVARADAAGAQAQVDALLAESSAGSAPDTVTVSPGSSRSAGRGSAGTSGSTSGGTSGATSGTGTSGAAMETEPVEGTGTCARIEHARTVVGQGRRDWVEQPATRADVIWRLGTVADDIGYLAVDLAGTLGEQVSAVSAELNRTVQTLEASGPAGAMPDTPLLDAGVTDCS